MRLLRDDTMKIVFALVAFVGAVSLGWYFGRAEQSDIPSDIIGSTTLGKHWVECKDAIGRALAKGDATAARRAAAVFSDRIDGPDVKQELARGAIEEWHVHAASTWLAAQREEIREQAELGDFEIIHEKVSAYLKAHKYHLARPYLEFVLGHRDFSEKVEGQVQTLLKEVVREEQRAFGDLEAKIQKAVRASSLAQADLLIADARRKGYPEALVARAARMIPKDVPRVFGLSFVFVRSEVFILGTPERERGRDPMVEPSPRRVRVDGFYISTTEVTQEAYAKVIRRKWERYAGPMLPAHTVSYDEATEFCVRLGATDATYDYDLPTEEEWETACRAGLTAFHGPFAVPDTDRARIKRSRDTAALVLQKYAYFEDNKPGSGPAEVMRRRPNLLGLYDMHGNVFEWCRPSRLFNDIPLGHRVVRGGSVLSRYERCRAGARGFEREDNRKPTIGFRIVGRRK